ncbi:putative retrotransposon hot spot protein 4 (RHS4) [Trypanosoma vivax]|nr:putative retrotransposon hot spot protein 4 (RHS4) [Trypanosoma vivax]
MAGRKRLVRKNESGGAAEPPLVQPRVESVPDPQWTLGSRVRDVLLDGVPPPDKKMLSECLKHVGYCGPDIKVDARMDIVIQRPELFIPDAYLREMILSLPECRTYALVYKVIPLLEEKGITSVRQWDDADKNADAKCAVRDELADERLWNKTRGLLDAAFSVAKDADEKEKIERKRVRNAVNAAAEVIPGAFESVVNARWSCVESGHDNAPLGMRVVDGPLVHTNAWSFEELEELRNAVEEREAENPNALVNEGEVAEEEEEEEKGDTSSKDEAAGETRALELLVLTSERGWPYTEFIPSSERDVFVRREVMRVWHVVRSELARWPDDDSKFDPRPYVLVGTPGIGKSFGCGSYLLYELLHYDAAKVPTVAYFVRGSAYIFHKTGAMAGRVVFYKKADDALTEMWYMAKDIREALVKRKEAEGVMDAEKDCRAKCGFIIFDVGEKHQPRLDLPTSEWGCIVLSSPSERNYKGWKKHKMAYYIFINCYTALEIKAFFAWQQRALLYAAANDAGARADIDALWDEVELRVDEVGPLPRYVFDDKAYKERCNKVADKLKNVSEQNAEHYIKILVGNEEWIEDGTTHAVIKLVRTIAHGVEHCRNHPVSSEIEARLRRLLIAMHCGKSSLVRALATMEEICANRLEQFGMCAFLYPSIVEMIGAKMRYLPRPRDRANVQTTVLLSARAVGRCPSSYKMLDIGSRVKCGTQPPVMGNVEHDVLYIPVAREFPVVDAFYFVKSLAGNAVGVDVMADAGAGEHWTLVCVQVTRQSKHGTSTYAVNDFMAKMAQLFNGWAQLRDSLALEMIYVQHVDSKPITRWQRCEKSKQCTLGERRAALALWGKCKQYQVLLDKDICTALLSYDKKSNATAPSVAGAAGGDATGVGSDLVLGSR